MNTYVKVVDNLEDALYDVIEYIPNLEYFLGENYEPHTLISKILEALNAEIDSLLLGDISFSISPSGLKLVTDEKIEFGWVCNDNIHKVYLTFPSISRSMRKYVNDLLDHGWEELGSNEERLKVLFTSNRGISKTKEVEEETQVEESVVSSVQEEHFDTKYDNNQPLPTFFEDEDVEEDTDTDTHSSDSVGDMEDNRYNNEDVEEENNDNTIKEEELIIEKHQTPGLRRVSPLIKNPYEEEETSPQLSFTFKQQHQQVQQQSPTTEVVEDYDIDEMRDAQEIINTPKQMILPNGKVTESTKNIVPFSNIDQSPIDLNQYNIRAGNYPSQVIITYQGEEFPYNVNEYRPGIIRISESKKLIIENKMLYDYSNFTVQRLPNNYRPDQAQFIGSNTGNYGPIPDEAFVPESTIRKNEYIDVEAIQEEQIEIDDFNKSQGKMTPNWKRPNLLNRAPKKLANPTGAFVLNRGSHVQPRDPKKNFNGRQTVQISNEEDFDDRRRGF